MFEGDFGEKCIIMQFLGTEKDRKSVERRVRRERFEEDQRRENRSSTRTLGPPEGVPYEVVSCGKSFICITITHRSL